MASLELRGINKSYAGKAPVLQGIDLQIAAGEFMVFVGPSGCGKSTLLRMIAGLEDISAGSLYIDGVLSNAIAPARRGIAMVFQSYALYPHMTVFENMAFGLGLAGVKGAALQQAVQQAAATLQLTELLERKPAALSGGQRQRVAIGRAIVRQPRVFLFDEPLSNLDASLRGQMRLELARLHRALGTTMVYVTHDQVEAMTLGQRIAVFDGGHIAQVGTPQQLYTAPANLFVARFLGAPKMNLLRAGAGQGSIGIRPEHLQPCSGPGAHVRQVVSTHCEYLGDQHIVYGQTCDSDETLAWRSALPVAPGTRVYLGWDPAHCHLFNTAGFRTPPA